MIGLSRRKTSATVPAAIAETILSSSCASSAFPQFATRNTILSFEKEGDGRVHERKKERSEKNKRLNILAVLRNKAPPVDTVKICPNIKGSACPRQQAFWKR
jgi:hypothetical protein